MRKFIQSRSTWEIAMVSVLSLFATVGVVMAATTIGTSVTTAGSLYASSTLYVSGVATIDDTLTLANASSTGQIKVSDITTTAAGITFNSKNFTSVGNIAFATASSTGAVQLASITSTAAGISFTSKNLTSVGNIGFATASSTGLATLDSVKISTPGTAVTGLLWGTCIAPFGNVTASSTPVATCVGSSAATTAYSVIVTPISTSSPYMAFVSASTTASGIQVAAYNTGWGGVVSNYTLYLTWMAIK